MLVTCKSLMLQHRGWRTYAILRLHAHKITGAWRPLHVTAYPSLIKGPHSDNKQDAPCKQTAMKLLESLTKTSSPGSFHAFVKGFASLSPPPSLRNGGSHSPLHHMISLRLLSLLRVGESRDSYLLVCSHFLRPFK